MTSSPPLAPAAPGPLKISGSLDIHGAPALRDTLLAHLTAPAVVLDLSAVTACDLTGLQVLCAARVSAGAAGHTFLVTAPSVPVSEACAALGLTVAELSTS